MKDWFIDWRVWGFLFLLFARQIEEITDWYQS